MKKKLFFLVVLLVTMVSGAWGAGFTRTLTGNLEVTGYELKAFYDFQTNTPAVLPTEGDLRYRDGNVWGLHNFASGPRTAEVQIPVSEGNLLILQEYVDEPNGITGFNATINCGTANDELSTSTGYHVFDITSNATTINITVPRYGGVVAALVMKVTGSEEAELPNLNDYELVKSVTWGDGTSLAGSETCPYKAFETGNKKMQPLTILTSPTDAAGWIAMQGWKVDNSNGWWNRENFGLYSSGGARSAAVFGDDLTTGWLVVFECTQDPSNIMTLTNGDGAPDGTFTYVKDVKNYYCTINAASNAYVGFCGNKSVGYISKISVYKPKSAVVENAEITKVELQGNFATTGTDWNAVSLTEQSDNVYSGVLDLTGYTDDKSFKLVVNGGGSDSDGYAGWIGTNNVSVDAPKDWVVSTSETDNGNLTLNNSKTGYQTYTVTATWEPNVDYYKGWSLKIEGKDARKYAVSVADGITNGTVTVDKTEAAEGEEVTVTATPAKGYELDAITVTGKTSNQAVTVTDGKFTMIADAVTVSATFKESPTGDTFTLKLDNGATSDPAEFFTVSKDGGAASYNAKYVGKYDGVSYAKPLKVEAATQITFTSLAKGTLTVVQSTLANADKTIKLDGTALSKDGAATPSDENNENVRVYTIENLGQGNHVISRGDGESGILYVQLVYTAEHVHEFVLDPDQSSEPSCTEPGKKVSVCICGEKEEEEIPAHGHIIGENGICTVCGYNSNQGGTTEGHHYEKVTSANDFTDGEYLIVYETGNVALNGALDGNIDAVSNYVAVEIKNGNIASSDVVDAAAFTFATTTDQETSASQTTIKNASGFYIGHTGTKNTLNVSEETAFGNTVSFDDDGNALIVCDGYNLRYNSASGQTRFRYFSSTTQQHIALYKKVAGALPTSAVATPEISGETPFVGSTVVTITCETEGANIYYTTDGTDPTDESTAYVEPFELTATATVKAIAYDVTGANSDVASKEFVATPTVANIAALNALENGTTFAYTGEALVVAKAANENKTYVFIKDETGSSLIYDADASKTEAAVVGKTIAANWTGKVTVYKNLFEAVPDAALSVKDGEAVEVTYPEAQLTDVVADNVSQVVELKGVTYTLDGKSLTISQGQAETAGYNQFGMEIAAAEEGKTYNIVGAIGRYNDNIQFWPISIEEAQTEPAPLYVIGDISTGGWDRTNMTQMEFNVDTKANEYSFTIDNEFATFAIATYQMTAEEAAEDPQWSTFNAEYRWAIGDYDIDASDYVNGDAVQLVKGTTNGTVKLPKGTYIVSVDPETMMMTITGTITPKPKLEYEAVYAVGNGTEGSAWMNGENWTANAEANKMTKVEGTDHLWEITFKDVTAGEYKAKFAIDGTWDINFGGSFLGYGFETNAEFNSSDIVFTTTAEKQDITLRIDLSNYNPTTNEGATFTVIAPKEQNTYVVAGCVGEKEGGADDELFGKAWDGAAEANQLAYDATSKLFTKTYEAVAFEGATDIFYKIVISGWKWVPDGANLTCEIPAAGTYDITVTYNAETGEATMTATPSPEDIVINPEDITGGDITAAIAAKTEGKTVKNLTINLAAGEAYTLSKTITAPNNLVLKGDDKNPATITLAADMTDNVITLDGTKAVAKKSDGTDSDHKLIASVEIIGVKILGLQAALIKDTQKTLLETLTISDAIVEMPAAGKNVLDFNSKGYVGKVIVKNSTIYAKGKNTGFFAQYGSRPKNVNGDWLQEFDVQNSTIVNIANGKNFCDLKQNGTAQNVYTLKNNIFADCGKQNQVVVGFNKGQASATPVWDVDANVFNWGGADVSAAETTSAGKKAEEDIVKNSHAGVITFTDAANGDFNGVFTAEPVKEEPAAEEATSRRADATATLLNCGDPRWTIELKQGQTITIADNIKHGTVVADKTYAGQGTVVTVTATPDENFKLEKITVEGEGVDLAIEVTMDAENPNVGTFTMPAVPVIVRAMFKYVIPAGTHILNINDIYAAAQAKTAPCENATLVDKSTTKYLLNQATIEMDIFTIVSKSDRSYRIDANTDVDYGDYESWSRLEPNGTSNKTGGRQMFIDVPEGGGVLYMGAHGNLNRTLYVTKAADKTSYINVSSVAEADVMLKHAFVAGEDKAADFNVYKVQLAAGLYCITQDNGIYFTYLKFVEGETYTAPTVSVDALKAEIAAAKTLLGKADITVDPGKALNTAIETATTALKSVNAETTQETVNQAVTDLQAAEAAFKLVVAKGKLTDEIATATELLGEASTEAGTPGADLKKAIDDAQAVLDNTESTLEEVNKATEDLKTAEEAYKTATSINGINASKFADGAWYTTGGVRIDKPTKKGLYIHNGRTVVVK